MPNSSPPPIDGHPKVVTPEDGLHWPLDLDSDLPSIGEPTANILNDVHGVAGGFDLVLATSGNYHMALLPLWREFLRLHAQSLNINAWLYTTSPPFPDRHIQHGGFYIGNLQFRCTPHVVVAPLRVMRKLQQLDITLSEPESLCQSHGNVLLVRKGNPKDIHGVWDLARDDVVLATPNPRTEPGTFSNFSNSLYTVAEHTKNSIHAQSLFNAVFNRRDNPGKWICGQRIMHREIPWAINAGRADAAVLFYHLAKYMTDVFVDKFEIVPLDGLSNEPQQVPGNQVEVLYLTVNERIDSASQKKAALALRTCFMSDYFTRLLTEHGLQRAV